VYASDEWFQFEKKIIKGALNPNFLNLTINRDELLLKIRFGAIS